MDNWLIILFIVLKSSLIIEDSEEILSSKHALLSIIHKMLDDLGFHLVTSLLLKCQQWQLHVDGVWKKLTVVINEDTIVELKS